MTISPIDAIVIAVYLVGITAFGIKVGYQRKATSQQYFLANKSLGWFTVGAAVFTSNISTIHLVGYAAGGARDGLVIGNFEWMACFILILLALMFAPFYINSGVATLPEFMERRYCPAARTFLAVIGIMGALLIHIGISLFAAAKVFESLARCTDVCHHRCTVAVYRHLRGAGRIESGGDDGEYPGGSIAGRGHADHHHGRARLTTSRCA